jgi:hypothetical protein
LRSNITSKGEKWLKSRREYREVEITEVYKIITKRTYSKEWEEIVKIKTEKFSVKGEEVGCVIM